MKKTISFIIILSVILCIASISVSAAYEREADVLNQLGLFQGTNNGYELEQSFTRAQGVTMLVRLLGKETYALAGENLEPAFEDVSKHWSKPYVNYCVQNLITKGTSDTTFSPDDKMTGAQYITLLMRAMGYSNVDPDNAYIAAAEYSLATSGMLRIISEGSFTRDKMVYISYQALFLKDSMEETLLDKLIRENVISNEIAENLNLIKNEKITIN